MGGEEVASPVDLPRSAHRNEAVLSMVEKHGAYFSSQEGVAEALSKGFFLLAHARNASGLSRSYSVRDVRPEFKASFRLSLDAAERAPAGPGRVREAAESKCGIVEGEGREGSDPLELFGGIVSPKLRQAQALFRRAMMAAVESSRAARGAIEAREGVRGRVDALSEEVRARDGATRSVDEG